MSKVVVVTDSTAYIPDQITEELDIRVIPLHVVWGDKVYKDNVDLKSDVFYPMLKKAKDLPTTSQPSPKEFMDLYKSILDHGDKIISIHISSGISGTTNSASQAKEMLASQDIEIIDSRSTGMALGFVAVVAARLALKNASLQECKALAKKAVENIDVFFMVNTLEYLHKGGRIGGASALLGSALDLKPILYLKDGKIESYEKVRTKKKAINRIIEISKEKIGTRRPLHIAIIQVEAEEDAAYVKAELEKIYKPEDIEEFMITGLSPVIGTHTGPGVIAISYLAGI
ncbi:MAG: DegV family protein [Anaerolineaceae bacterium]|jgi:DegV family protein with EDD domain|nr:MAG: DegV family protein [Anaerolineaceae bacterium]